MSHSPFDPQAILELPDHEARYNAIIEHFNQAIDTEDHETARKIAELAIKDDKFSLSIPLGVQAKMWSWWFINLRIYHSETEDDSPEEEAFLGEILEALWCAKWIIAGLPKDLEVSLEEIQDFNQQISAHYADIEFSSASLHKALMEQSITLGNIEAAHQHFKQWQAESDDNFPDCEACQQDSIVGYHYFIGDYEQAIEQAMPILKGKMYCGEVPHLTYYPVIDSFIRLGRIEEAKHYLAEGTELITREVSGFGYLIPKLVQLHTRLGEHQKAIELLEQHVEEMIKYVHASPLYGLQYLMARMAYDDAAKEKAVELAKLFDERNGNQHYQTQIELLDLKPENLH